MYLSMGTCGCCLLLFQLNRLDRLVFQKYTAKYLQSAEERFLLGVIGTAGIAGFGWCGYLFYVTLRQSKTPPHEPDGYMLPTDEMANWSTWILYILVLISCVYSFYVMSGSRDKFSLVSSERFLQKLGMNAKVAETRRTFIGKIPKKIDSLENYSSARTLWEEIGEIQEQAARLRKGMEDLYRIAAAAYMEAKQVYVRIKYANPAFRACTSPGLTSLTALDFVLPDSQHTVDCWFLPYRSLVRRLLFGSTHQVLCNLHFYGIRRRDEGRDWFDEIWTNKVGWVPCSKWW